MKKNDLRIKYLNVRKEVDKKDEKSNDILNKIIELDGYKKANLIGIYSSLKEEVDTINIILKALNDHKRICIPKVMNKETIEFFEIKDLTDLRSKGSFGILEPVDANKINKKEIDLMIVPGIAFDKYLNRIGFGKGYYDRYLKDYKKLKVGICFDEQITDLIPSSIYDIKMDLIITDKRLLKNF